MDRTDTELLGEFCHGSQAALASLIRRHIDLVYAIALRRTGDPGLSDDVTQAVFIILMQKARALRRHKTVAGWLCVTTQNVARAANRARARRRQHEMAAAKPEGITMNSEQAACSEVGEMLDDLLRRLRAGDRDAVALRYLEGLSLSEVGCVLGISEEAAGKRVRRALERLRRCLMRQGVEIGAGGIGSAIGAVASLRAPAGTVAAATAITSAQRSKSAIGLTTEVLRMMALRKFGIAAA
ncbi:MAG TPA: sigma-70 family RNA polymerase sigma factor, partial [Tepidisphaeraceae bacterium]|nr:sigma-70 family RNA polymerase sigma factor [Tepidisphaeraceae bacterium]